MNRPRVYVAFDYDDASVKGDLVAQSQLPDCSFDLVDCSIEKAVHPNWALTAEQRILECDVVVVLCGLQTHQAGGASTELQIAQRLGRRCVFLSATRSGTPTAPRGTPMGTRIWTWRWSVVADLLAARMPPSDAVRRTV